MDLHERQKELQRGSYDLLKERIEVLCDNRGSDVQRFAKAGGLLGYTQSFIVIVKLYIEEYLQQIIGKVLNQDNDYYAKLLGVEYKNIDDAVAKPLSWVLFDSKRLDETTKAIGNSKNNFKTMEENNLKKRIQTVIIDLKKHIAIGGDYYNDLSL